MMAQNLSRLWFSTLCRHFATKELPPDCKYVLGCGSNVVDQLFRVQALPKPGEKGFFRSPTKILEKSVVGGVTLNHLAWASLFGVPTGLLALQGNDPSGRIIRDKLNETNMLTDFIQVDETYTTAESYVFVQEDGERSIIMASGATSMINGETAIKNFRTAVESHAAIFTTEISQVPLEGVIALLKIARLNHVAFNEAKLGSLEQLKEVISLADILKPAKHAATQLIELLNPDVKSNQSTSDISKYLLESSSAKLVALTNGNKPSIIATEHCLVEVETETLDQIVDATGAGDAFLGGLVAGLYFNGFPQTEHELREIGKLANKAGAANCMVLGALPEDSSSYTALQIKWLVSICDALRDLLTLEQFKKRKSNDGGTFLLVKVTLADEISKYSGSKKAISSFVTDSEKVSSNFSDIKSIFTESIYRDCDAILKSKMSWNYKNIELVVNAVLECKGTIFTTGIGKSGIVSQRLSASLSSIGCPSHYVHASEWVHGDLGKLASRDRVIVISHSGNTDEIINVIEHIKIKDVPVIAILGNSDSAIGKMFPLTSICYDGKDLEEPLGGMPTASLVLQEAIINGLMNIMIEMKKLTRKDFLRNHPGGALGTKLKENTN